MSDGEIMALIKCSECGKDVSDKAASCPGCGNPIAVPEAMVDTPNKVSTEEISQMRKSPKWILSNIFGFDSFLYAYINSACCFFMIDDKRFKL